ncbi:hypothetical protein [Psychroserpens jangbogonensis]|uniref:hypothetical protein n=1 Tax=Psychroserpens jangbogonensis TaxID=1484460 RepID=UPI00053D2D36|nr:hypothetical protein [Psychroserpens jangbogonensis]
MKYLHLCTILLAILLAILFSSCGHNEDNRNSQDIELNCTSDLKYIKRNGRVDSTMIDYIKADWSKRHKIEFIAINDTLFAYGSKLNEKDKNYRLSPYVTSIIKQNSKLVCSKKLIIHQNEIKYSFCYSDVIDFFDKNIKKGEKDIKIYLMYTKGKEKLQNHIADKESIFYCDYIMYELLMNLSYRAYDKYTKMEISKIILSDYYAGWSGGSEYYLLDKKNDTISYKFINRWVN